MPFYFTGETSASNTMIPIRPKPLGSTADGDGDASPPRRDKQAIHTPPPSRVTSKPVPERQLRSPREYQIDQLKRRFSPKESTDASTGETSLIFSFKPSDPDFPYDLEKLECDLRIPRDYPTQHAVRLLVRNKDIPRGFAVNIERGWDRLHAERKGKGGGTLLTTMNALDRGLEQMLAQEKQETVKITVFKDSRHLEGQPQGVIGKESIKEVPKPVEQPKPAPRPYIPMETFTRDQIAEAKARRAQEVRQLEARMSRLPLYHKSSDGVIYTLPLDPKRRSSLPSGLQSVHSVQLVIPLLYPLQPLRVLLNDVDADEAEAVEELFTQKAVEQKQMSLTSHLNYLATNLHALAKQAAQEKQKAVQAAAAAAVEEGKGKQVADEEAKEAEHVASAVDGERGHLRVIPRPVEWTLVNAEGSSEDDSETESDTDDDYEFVDGEGNTVSKPSEVTPGTTLPTATAERGTALSFPSIELHGIELLQVALLSLSVKCNRCKTLNDVTSLKPSVEKLSSCKKCATSFSVTFRPELVHANSTRAGFIDLSGCTVSDMLPSSFIPTCGRCSTSYPSPGFVSVRGETTTNVCRECHARFTFKIPDIKFLTYSSSFTSTLPPTTGPRRRDQKLGLHAGDPLPDRGACAHYKRSYRWFRFSCCNKVYPCDKCHQAAEDHVDEWANRMICGWCSREQNYRVENCAFCGRSVVRKRTGGYWEGGKGTRDKVLMRRGDRRKYRNKRDGNKGNK